MQSSKTYDPAPASLASAVVRGITWNTAGVISQVGVGLVAAILVARHLTPRDFAIAGIAVTVVALLNAVVTNTFGAAIVQRGETTPLLIDSVFWLMTVGGLALAAAVTLLGGAIAGAYGEPAVAVPLAVLTSTIVANAAGQVPLALLQRRMQFREIVVARTIGLAIAAFTAIVIAMRGGGYWALIAQQGIGEWFAALGAIVITRYIPRARFSAAAIGDTASFASAAIGYNLLYTAGARADYLVMARYWPAPAAGLYFFAYERSRQILNLMLAQIAGTLLPALSRMQHDTARLRAAYGRSTRLWCLVAYPLHVLLIGLADPFVPLLLGQQWREAIGILQIFVVFTLIGGPWSLASDTLTAAGWPRGNLYFAILRVGTTLAALVVLGSRGASIQTTAVTMIAVWFVIAPVWGLLLRHAIGMTFGEVWSSVRAVIAVSALMMAVLFGSKFLLLRVTSPPIAAFVAALVAATVYALLLRAPIRELRDELLRAIQVRTT